MARILCIEADIAVRESRCAVLKASGYDTVSASPQVAEIALRSQKFDLVVLSSLNEYERNCLMGLTDGADVLALDGLTMPWELLSLVAERVHRQERV